MINTSREDPRDQVKSKHEDWNQAVCKIAKKRAHCGDRTLDRTLDKQPDAATGRGQVARQTGDWILDRTLAATDRTQDSSV